MRNIVTVVGQLKPLVHNPQIHEQMDRVVHNAGFTAPELMYERWEELHEILFTNYLPDDFHNWDETHVQICAIFTDKTVEETRQALYGV